jgi:tetratricopeptide (TPR) repeat protein
MSTLRGEDSPKPAPKAEPHSDEGAEPELKFTPYKAGPVVPELLPVPKAEPHHDEHSPSEPKAEPHKAGPLEPMPAPHVDEEAKPERKVEAHEVGHEKPDTHAEPKTEPHAEPKADEHAAPKTEVEPAELLAIEPARNRTPPIVRRGRLSTQPAKALFDRLAAAGKMKLEWSAAAEDLVHDRMLRIDVVEWPLHDLLHLLADSLELVSWAEGDVVRFATPAESPNELVEASRWNLVQQTARTALISAPHHALAPAIAIHLGRLELNAERTTQAILCYEEAIRRQARGPWTISAWYDLGIVHSGLGNVHAARKAFFACIDEAPGHPLAPLAYVHVARLHMEEGAIDRALTTLYRTRRNYPNDPTQPAVSLLTALAHAQRSDFAAVQRTLAADRKILADSPYRPATAFVEAYALYRLAKLESNARPETTRLIEALYAPGDTMSAALETQLLGKACRDIRMAPEAARIYEKTLAWYKGPLRPALEFGRAESLLDSDEREAAAILLRSLEAGPTSRWSVEATLRLAEIDLDDGDAQASVDRCRKVWAERELSDANRILPVWGNALSALGDFEKASRCFAGNPPE